MPNFLLKHLVRLLLVFWTIPLAAGTLLLEGTTSRGFRFSGRLAALSGDILYLESEGAGHGNQVGIPLQETTELRVMLDASTMDLDELEAFSGLLPFLSEASRQELMDWVIPRAMFSDLEVAYVWAGRFARSSRSPGQQLQARLHGCHAMLELGQLRLLEDELDGINRLVDPIDAPATLCWLNAEISRHKGLPDAVLYWASLPLLRIPACSDPLRERLESLCDDVEADAGENKTHAYR